MSEQIMNNGGKYGHLFMQELKLPSTHSGEALERYRRFGERVHWVDSNNMPGAFQMNTSWWYKPNGQNRPEGAKGVSAQSHQHPYPEILGFYGSNPEDPYDLGGEIELWIDGECHILTKSTMVFLPPDVPHCPLRVNKVDRPIFHFSVVMNSLYTQVSEDGEVKVSE